MNSSNIQPVEASTRGVLWKKVFLEVSQNSQVNTCARVSFSIKFLKKRLWHSCFLVNFAKFLGTPFHRTTLDDCFSTCFFLLILVITFSNMFKNLFTVLQKNNFISKSLKNNRRTEKSIPRKCQKFQFNNLFCPRPSSFLKNVFLTGVSSWDHSLSLI